ncbi:AraC family transcriptional regulator [Leptospira sp. 201903070]|uniref:AraC family transcriptional regulator n=1 Tax=Leptospira ainlahdjerensis TaxID=2810033 RepID=A0ABS2UEE2_9LEPT|nr:helix-turn-helix domain-containing protein [Leptospira ainlahdjerensis]MBM9578746.1 AraC family transcriptional regulator [Leptospira ainlahdjerensis]
MDNRFLTISALLYILIGFLRFKKESDELRSYQALLFLSLGCILWSYSATSCSTEGGLFCSALEFFFVFSSLMAALVFYHFQKKLRSGIATETDLDSQGAFLDPIKIVIQSILTSSFIFLIWKFLPKNSLPGLIASVSFFISIYYILIFVDILVRFRRTGEERINLLPFLTVILVVKGLEVIRQNYGFSSVPSLVVLDEYFILLSPIVLHEIVPKERWNILFRKEVEDRIPPYLEVSAVERNPYSSRKSQVKYNLLGNLNLLAVDQKLKNLFEVEKVYLDEDLRLPALAEDVGISVHHLSAFINEYLGLSFNRFINFYRVEAAKSMLLEEPERTVLSIGVAVGFNSTSAFHRAFFLETGLTPKQFRENQFENRGQVLPSSSSTNFNLN